MLQIDKMVLVVEPYRTLDTPVVVYEIRVEKVHAPALLRRRETAQEQHLGVGRKKRLKWMIFYYFYQELENVEKTEVLLLNLRQKSQAIFHIHST